RNTMSELPHARSFRELIVYRKARAVAKRIFQISKRFPREEMYSLTDQGRRSSRSVGAQITEAWAKRRYEKHFVSKLTDADGEQLETQHWTRIAFSCGYIEEAAARSVIATLEEIGRLLQGMIDKAEAFCSVSKVAETSFIYFTDSDDPLVSEENDQI